MKLPFNRSAPFPGDPPEIIPHEPAITPYEPVADGWAWEIAVIPQDTEDAAWRGRLLGRMRAAIEDELKKNPGADVVRVPTALGTIEARATGRPGRADAPVRLAFAPGVRDLPAARHAGPGRDAPDLLSPLPALRLPDPETALLGQRLVGLDATLRDLLLRWGCLWDGELEAWSSRAARPVPPALAAHLKQAHALSVFHGDPGTGKSALAHVASHNYCVRRGIAGTVLSLTTEARGEGLVGQFSQRLRAGFDQLLALPEGTLRVLLIDEADALAMRRSEAQSHQEDRSATATILQVLDSLVGRPRTLVVMTTNLLTGVDAAVRRRAHCVAFPRPDAVSRARLLAPWLAGASARDLERASAAACDMTPADIERTLLQAWLSAVGRDAAPTPAQMIDLLHRAERTGAV